MKQLIAALAAFVLVSQFASTVKANEGYLSLTGDNVACEGVSLWDRSSFRVTGRCDGLVYPYATQQERYVIWGKTTERGELMRISEVERGYFDGIIQDNFTDLYVTAEAESLPRRPSSAQVASGKLEAFAFAKGESSAVATPAPLAQQATQENNNGTMTVQNGAAAATATGSTVASAIGKILRSLLIIIAVVVVLVVGTSLVFRRRGSVSA